MSEDKIQYKTLTKGRIDQESTSNTRAVFFLFSNISEHMAVKSASVFIILMVFETFHQLYLSIVYLPNQYSLLQGFSDILTIINFPRVLLNSGDATSWMFLILLWTAVALFVLATLVCLFIVLFLSRRPVAHSPRLLAYASSFISMAVVLFQTVLLLPGLEVLIFPVTCYGLSNGQAPLELLVCGSASQISIACVGVLLAIIVTIIYFSSSLILLEDYYYSTLPWAGELRDTFYSQAVAKFVLSLYTSIDIDHKYYGCAVIAGLLLYLAMIYQSVRTLRFFSHPSVQLFYEIQLTTLAACYFYASVHLLYDNGTIMVSVFLVIILGIVLGVLLHVHDGHRKRSMLFNDRTQLKLLRNAEEYVRCMCATAVTQRKTPFWQTVYKYILRVHYLECPNSDCICKRLICKNESEEPLSPSMSPLQVKRQTEEDARHFMKRLVGSAIEAEANKWKQSQKILLEACYYQLIIMKNFFKAYYWVMCCESSRAGFSEKFIQHRVKFTLAQNILLKESKDQNVEQVEAIIRFQTQCGCLRRTLQYTTKTVASFWKLFETIRFNVDEIFSMAHKIAKLLNKSAKVFKRCCELVQNYPYIYYHYGHFVRLVLNNNEEAADYIEKGDEISVQMQESRFKYHEDMSISMDNAMVIVSGNVKNLGTILYTNQHVKEHLGFSMSDLEGRNVSRLMPAIIGERHDEFMLRHYQTGMSYVLGKERLMFVQTKYGLIEPVCMIVKTVPSVEFGIRYLGSIRRDSVKLRNSFVKMPSQYKGEPICFIMTDDNGIIVGISKRTCSLFGLSPKYIKRKKGLTSLPFPIGKLAPELDGPATEKLLLNGMHVTIKTSAILDYLDYDFLKRSEEELVYSSVKEKRNAYVVMAKSTYHGILSTRIYALIDIPETLRAGRTTRRQTMTARKKKRDSLGAVGGSSNNIFAAINQSKIPSPSSLSRTSQLRSDSLQNISKGGRYNDFFLQATSVKRIKITVLLFLLAILGGIVTDYMLYLTYLDDIIAAYPTIKYSQRRLVHFNLAVHKIFSYIDSANSLEPSYPLITNDTDAFLTEFHKSELDFEKTVLESYVSTEADEVIYPMLNVTKILSDFEEYTEKKTLNSAIYELVSQGSLLFHTSSADCRSQHYVNSFVSANSGDTLTVLEREMYFFFANVLGEPHRMLVTTEANIYEAIWRGIDKRFAILLWIQIGVYGIFIMFNVVFIPTLLNIQKNKRKLLMNFAELSFNDAEKLVNNCKDCSKLYLERVLRNDRHSEEELEKESGSDKSANEESVVDRKGSRIGFLAQEQGTFPTEEETTQVDKAEQDRVLELKMQEKIKAEQNAITERKRGIQNVSVSLGYVIVVVSTIFIVILTYYSKTLLYIFINYSELRETMDNYVLIQQRFAYTLNTLLYYRSYLKSLTRFECTIDSTDAFEYFLDASKMSENSIAHFKTYPTSAMKPVADAINEYDSSKFCSRAEHLFTSINFGWCPTIKNGLLNEGLSATIIYALKRIEYNYVILNATTDAAKVEAMKRAIMADSGFMNTIAAFLVVFHPVTEEIEDLSSQKLEEYITRMKELVLLDFVIMMFIIVAAFVVLFKYIMKTIEAEIFTEKGIMTILPVELLEKMKRARDQPARDRRASLIHKGGHTPTKLIEHQ